MSNIPDFRLPPPSSRRVQLAALRAAFGDRYNFSLIVVTGDKPCYEAVSKDGGSPYCLISDDVREIWRELRAAA